MSESKDVVYYIRAFDRNSGILTVDYPDWGEHGMRINVRLEPDRKTGKVLSGNLLDDYLKKCRPPYVEIKNADEIAALVQPIEQIQSASSFKPDPNNVPSHIFYGRFHDNELGQIWVGAANNPHVAAVLFKMIKNGNTNVADPELKQRMQTLVDAKLLTPERMQAIMMPVAS